MINRIKNKLIVKYMTMMSIMLAFVFIGNFFVIKHIIMESSKASVEKYLYEEIDEAIPPLTSEKSSEPSIYISKDNEDAFYNFVYWFDKDNNLIMANELSETISEKQRELMASWEHPEKQIELISIKDNNGKTWDIIMTYSHVYYKETNIGKVFVGKNLTSLKKVQKEYILVVIAFAIIMLSFAFLLSNKMANKAMEPIIEAFDKQNKFVADASHEMRTPLSVMLSSIDLIKTTSKENIELKNNIKSEILNMKNLVNELLDLARYDDVNKNKLNYKSYNIIESLENVIKSIDILAKNRSIKITLNNEKNIEINADENKIKQVTYILLDNAIKYSKDNTCINVKVEEIKNNIKVSIKDEGIGINKADQENIFNRFYRVNKARSRSIGGSGLGLSIASEIIKQHNGIINVESDGKNGSTFFFIIKK